MQPSSSSPAYEYPTTETGNTIFPWIVLATLATVSGILSMTLPPIKVIVGLFIVGAIFGSTLAAYFVLCERLPLPRAIFLIVASAAAYPFAYYASIFFLVPLLSALGGSQVDLELAIVFICGVIGGFLLLIAVSHAFQRLGSTFGSVRIEVIGSLLSGLVGAVAWWLGQSVGKTLWSMLPTSALPNGQTFNFYSLYPIWQTVMALFIGAMVAHKRIGDQPKGTTENAKAIWSCGPSSNKLVGTVLAIALGLTLARGASIRLSVLKRQAAAATELIETPSNKNLPAVSPLPLDQALIMTNIGEMYPGQPVQRQMIQSNEKGYVLPWGISYSLLYGPRGTFPYGSDTVSVVVQQYPNNQWAEYLAKYPRNVVTSNNPKHYAIVSRFQNHVRTNQLEYPGLPGEIYFIWPSGTGVITVTYNTTAPENYEIMRGYLEKYPSSIR